MKLLIITAWYHPFIHPRAHRWSSLASHWASLGHEVQVLTARVGTLEKWSVLDGVTVHRTGFDSLKEWVYHTFQMKNGRGRVGVPPTQPRRATRFLEWMYKCIWKNLFFPDDACIWYFPAKRKIVQLLEKEQFDAIISVSLPFTGHLLGLAAKQKFPGLLWLADMGDPFSIQAQPPNNQWLYRKKNLRLERQVLEKADVAVVTTNATCLQFAHLFGSNAVQKVVVIPPVLVQPSVPPMAQPMPPGINLGYFGALYAPTRTPSALLGLLEQVFILRPDLKGRLTVHFYGEIFSDFYTPLSEQPAICLHGLQSRAVTWAAMQAVDVLVNIGNTTDFQLPSKVVEYLVSGKPVLNLSTVDNDPFAHLFENNPLILNLLVKNHTVSTQQVLLFLKWLESEKQVPTPEELAEKARPFLVENIAAQYLKLLSAAPNG